MAPPSKMNLILSLSKDEADPMAEPDSASQQAGPRSGSILVSLARTRKVP